MFANFLEKFVLSVEPFRLSQRLTNVTRNKPLMKNVFGEIEMTREAETATKFAALAMGLAAAAILAVTAPGAFAGGAADSLPACYTHVINACNGTNHPEACAENGMNACDDYHGTNAAIGGQTLKMFKSAGRTPAYSFKFIPQQTRLLRR